MAKLVIVGAGETAELAHDYLTQDSKHDVVAFSVERAHATGTELRGLPIVDFEELERRYDPAEHRAFVAVSSLQLNRVRARLYAAARRKGYAFVSYVSPRAFVGRDVEVGDNCFILEHNVLQSGVRIGNDVVLWSGNHVGHRSVVRDHVFVASHVVISGRCEIGESSFLGVNSCVADNLRIARDCFVGMGAVVGSDTQEGRVYRGNPATASRVGSLRFCGVRPEPPRTAC